MQLIDLLSKIDQESINIRLVTHVYDLAFYHECQVNELTDTTDTAKLLESEIDYIKIDGNFLEIYL